MADRDILPLTYADWLGKAQKGFDDLRAQGIIAVKAYIDPDTFPDWCRARGLDINAKARMEYANLIAYQAASGVQ